MHAKELSKADALSLAPKNLPCSSQQSQEEQTLKTLGIHSTAAGVYVGYSGAAKPKAMAKPDRAALDQCNG